MSGYLVGSSGGGGGGDGPAEWIDYVLKYSSVPTVVLDDSTGLVLKYMYNEDSVTLYRFISPDASTDAFYSQFDGTTVSVLVAAKQASI